mmetsp:Transcript_18572/g.25838  ORF Transcript_18572/g.25838 Transcript_18572/m.25838 type:complete len:684 (-) Transcript_18572:561-2612(-)
MFPGPRRSDSIEGHKDNAAKSGQRKKFGHSVQESMDSTLRGFSNSLSSNKAPDVNSRRSRSRGSWHSRDRSTSWPNGSLLIGTEFDNPGGVGDPIVDDKVVDGANMMLESGKDFTNLLDITQPSTSLLLEPNTAWKSPPSENKAKPFFSGTTTPSQSPVSEARKAGKAHNRRTSSLLREQQGEAFVNSTFVSPTQTPKEDFAKTSRDWKSEGPKTSQHIKSEPNINNRIGNNMKPMASASTTQMTHEKPNHRNSSSSSAQNPLLMTSAQQPFAMPRHRRVGARKIQPGMLQATSAAQRQAQLAMHERHLHLEHQRILSAQAKLQQQQAALAQQQQILRQAAIQTQTHRMMTANAQQPASNMLQRPQQHQLQSQHQPQQQFRPSPHQQAMNLQQAAQASLNVQQAAQTSSQQQMLASQSQSQHNSIQINVPHVQAPPASPTHPSQARSQSFPTAGGNNFPTAPANANFRFGLTPQPPQNFESSGHLSTNSNNSFGVTSASNSPTWGGGGGGGSLDAFAGMKEDDLSPRTRKKMREKERRQILNAHYNTLLQLLKPRPNTKRMEKTTILEETIQMMQTLIRTNNVLQSRNKEMENEIRRLQGELKNKDSKIGSSSMSTEHKRVLSPSKEAATKVKLETDMLDFNTKERGMDTGGEDSPSGELRRRLQDVTVDGDPFRKEQLPMFN